MATHRRAFPKATVRATSSFLPVMRNHPDDRHVVAAALAAQAQVVVTNNLKHFRNKDLPPGMEAQSADEFLQDLFDQEPRSMLMVLAQAGGRQEEAAYHL